MAFIPTYRGTDRYFSGILEQLTDSGIVGVSNGFTRILAPYDCKITEVWCVPYDTMSADVTFLFQTVGGSDGTVFTCPAVAAGRASVKLLHGSDQYSMTEGDIVVVKFGGEPASLNPAQVFVKIEPVGANDVPTNAVIINGTNTRSIGPAYEYTHPVPFNAEVMDFKFGLSLSNTIGDTDFDVLLKKNTTTIAQALWDSSGGSGEVKPTTSVRDSGTSVFVGREDYLEVSHPAEGTSTFNRKHPYNIILRRI